MMWKADRWVSWGTIGLFISLVILIVVACTVEQPPLIIKIFFYSPLLGLIVFSFGYIYGGPVLGVKSILGFGVLYVLARVSGSIAGELLETGIIKGGLLVLSFLVYKRRPKTEIEINWANNHDVFLIMADKVYKVFFKDGDIYFCRVGGPFHEISKIADAYTCESAEADLLRDEFNYKIPVESLRSLKVASFGFWSSWSPNNGKVSFKTEDGKKYKFHIYPKMRYEVVADFFNKNYNPEKDGQFNQLYKEHSI